MPQPGTIPEGAGGAATRLHPYGYCRYCGRPRPEGALFCGGDDCETLAGRIRDWTVVAARRSPSRPEPNLGRRRDVDRPRDVHRQLLRDTSALLLVGALLVALLGALMPSLAPPAGAVLGATASPAFTAPAPAAPVPGAAPVAPASASSAQATPAP